MTIGNRIKKIRKELDLTQAAFAARIGSVQNTITGYENGRRNPSQPVISLICNEFNVNEEWLRTGHGEMFNPTPSSELDALVTKYNLSEEASTLIKKFINLKVEQQNVIINFIKEVADSLNEGNQKSNPHTDSRSTSIDIDAEVAAYRRALELQEKVTGKSYVSNGPDNISKNKKDA